MIIKIQISDAAYEHMMKHGTRIQGTIGLVNANEGNFNAHNNSGTLYRPNCEGKFKKLSHGRVTVTGQSVRVNLVVDRMETDVDVSDVILDDCWTAREFITKITGEL